jgi:hypothetical protein
VWARQIQRSIGFALIFLVLFASRQKEYTTVICMFMNNETPNIDMLFDNLQLTHIRGNLWKRRGVPLLHYYTLG